MKEFADEQFGQVDDLDAESRYLVHKAREATQHAYAPYSKFLVGAALLLDDGTLVTGSNQENASYPLCMCAERTAIYAALTQHPGKAIKKMAVVAHKKNHKELTSAASCGACRQVMLETEVRQNTPMEVIMMGEGNQWIKFNTVAHMLPHGFVPGHLSD